MSRRQQHSRQTSRLPPIAPRDGPPPLTSSAESTMSGAEASVRSPRGRLPPRSRSGCWYVAPAQANAFNNHHPAPSHHEDFSADLIRRTCRTRKVKCDEGRPRCNQCTRLGHVCDYNPRLAFKDETSKIVEKYLGGGSDSSRQWDTSKELSQEAQAPREMDTLPPFSALTTEEDWERKAGHRAPGTYYVIANSASFPTSGDSTPGMNDPRSPMTPSHSRRQSLYGGSTDAMSDDGLSRRTANIVLDEGTLILGSVEETSRQSQAAAGGTPSTLTLQLDQGRISPGSPFPFAFTTGAGDMGMSAPVGLPYPIGRYTQQDLRRRHYRTVVRKHMFGINGNDDVPHPDQSDIFEQEAERFPLLGTTLDELSAWSLAWNGGLSNFDTQENYLEILASLRQNNTEADLRKDGKFLAHALLLVYEISCSHRSWPLHLAALLHIFKVRGRELPKRFASLIPWVLYVDCNGLLCGTSDGEVSDFIFQNKLVPEDGDWLESTLPVGLVWPQNPSESQLTLQASKLGLILLNSARRLGHLAKAFRQQMVELESQPPNVRAAQISQWHAKTSAIRVAMEQAWEMFLPDLAHVMEDTSGRNEMLASACEMAWSMYHYLLMYSYTSMWPTQRMEESYADDEATVAQYCTSVLERCDTLLSRHEFSRRNLVFLLFLVGFFSQDPGEKRHALHLIHLMEQASIGNNTRAIRRWLERLYAEQAMAAESGLLFAVDWVTSIQEQQFCLVLCGF